MRARDIAEPFPTVTLDTDALSAVRLLAGQRLPGLIILGPTGRPAAVLPGSQVLHFVVPPYVQDEPALARAYDEKASDEMCRRLDEATVRNIVPKDRDADELPVVDADATTIEVAAVMARAHSPVVAVIDDDHFVGAITVSALLSHMIPA